MHISVDFYSNGTKVGHKVLGPNVLQNDLGVAA